MPDRFSSLKKSVSQNLVNIPGWKTGRKVVIIESDDWGSIRMPSKEVLHKFISRNLSLAESNYNRLDTLESNQDLEYLFEILSSFRDSVGKHPVITANTIVGNPDFQKILQSDFSQYHFEPVPVTLARYPGRDRVETLWKEGNSAGIFHPQFHGREHVNVVRWMNALKERTPEIMFTFEYETTFSGRGDYNFMEVLDYNTPADLAGMKRSLSEGLDIFENIFGYKSKSFIPPCYTWNSDVEETLGLNGVKYIQGLVIQSVPTGNFGIYKRKYHFLGSRNKSGQYFLIRNCFFEPSLVSVVDPVGECLSRIKTAFRWKKPAILSIHRINFIGTLDEKNRTNTLRLFGELLTRIIREWPDVEFLTSDQLGDVISGNDRHKIR
jgi:hypothetical protein